MRYTNLPAFEKHLGSSGDHLSSLYLIIAKQPFHADRALEQLLQALFGDQKRTELNFKQFDGQQLSTDTFLTELEMLPVFSPLKVILVRRLDLLNKEPLQQLEKNLLNLTPGIKLVLLADEMSATSTFFKSVDQHGVIFHAVEQKPWQKESTLVDWALRQAASEKKRLSPAVAQMLVKRVGCDETFLRQEMEKIICYCIDKEEITQQDVQAVAGFVDSDDIWQLGEALMRSDGAASIKAVRALLDGGNHLIMIVAQLRTQIQQLYQLCSLLANGARDEDLAGAFPKMSAAMLKRKTALARGYGVKRFKRALLDLADTEMLVKDSRADMTLLAERLIFRLITP